MVHTVGFPSLILPVFVSIRSFLSCHQLIKLLFKKELLCSICKIVQYWEVLYTPFFNGPPWAHQPCTLERFSQHNYKAVLTQTVVTCKWIILLLPPHSSFDQFILHHIIMMVLTYIDVWLSSPFFVQSKAFIISDETHRQRFRKGQEGHVPPNVKAPVVLSISNDLVVQWNQHELCKVAMFVWFLQKVSFYVEWKSEKKVKLTV